MGLFDKLKRKPAEPAVKFVDGKPEGFVPFPGNKGVWVKKPTDDNAIQLGFDVGVSAGAVKVEVGDGGLRVNNASIKVSDTKAQVRNGNTLLVEVTNRSQAYKDLKSFDGWRTKSVTIRKREGQHGTFYNVTCQFVVTAYIE